MNTDRTHHKPHSTTRACRPDARLARIAGKPTGQRGFTLIEVMIVVVILALLSTMVIQAVGDRPDQARKAKARNDISSMESAMKLYRLDNYKFPTQGEGLAALLSNPSGSDNWRGPYIDRLPKDPWGNAYQYRNPGTKGGKIDVFSYAADAAEGGADEGADIGNWSD